MKKLNFGKIEFLKSAELLSQLPADAGAEVAFAGRSNVGKSSVLNTLARIKKLAKVSKTPGRTQLLNFFKIDDESRLVDLPGYGYAQVPRAVKLRWKKTLMEYLETRQCLKGLILIMDIRHPLQTYDLVMLKRTAEIGLPVHILLNKADKFGHGGRMKVLHEVHKKLEELFSASEIQASVTIQEFSAQKRIGLEDAMQVLSSWLVAPISVDIN